MSSTAAYFQAYRQRPAVKLRRAEEKREARARKRAATGLPPVKRLRAKRAVVDAAEAWIRAEKRAQAEHNAAVREILTRLGE